MTEPAPCVCDHVADEHDGPCQVDGCDCPFYESDGSDYEDWL